MKTKLIILFTILSTSVSAQKKADETFGAWYIFSGSHKVYKKIGIKTLADFRFFDMANDMQIMILRIGGNYKINKNYNFTVGFGYFDIDKTFNQDGGEIQEKRIYQDFNTKHKIEKLTWTNRFRVEERLLDEGVKFRIRIKPTFTYPIYKKWSAYVYNESHFNGDGKAFNQTWTGLGIKYKVSDMLKIGLGYTKSITAKSDYDRLQVGVSYSTK